VPDAIHIEPDRFGDVVADELKAGVLPPLAHVRFAAREGVVETKHLLIGLHQPIHQMRAKEAGTTGDQIASRGGRHEQQKLTCQF